MNLTGQPVRQCTEQFVSAGVGRRSGPREQGCKRGMRKPGTRREPDAGETSLAKLARAQYGLTARRDGNAWVALNRTES